MRDRKMKIPILFIVSIIALLIFFVLNTSTIQSQAPHTLADGDLIKTAYHPDIYILKIHNNVRYKRLILNPTIFDSYGHLEWSDVKIVSQETLNSFIPTQLVREVYENGEIVNGRVYMLFANGDVGVKRYIQLNRSEFFTAGGRDSSIYNMNHLEASEEFYVTGPPITTVQQLRALLDYSLREEYRINQRNNTVLLPLPEPEEEPEQDTTRASLSFTKSTLQPTTILPGSAKEVLTINVLVSNRPITIQSIKVSLSPTSGTDTSIENTFDKMQLIIDGNVVSTKKIESTEDYEKVLNTALITLNNLAIDIEEDSTKSIQIHLSTVRESPLKDWNIIINKDSISAIDDDNNTYSNNNPITISTSVRNASTSRSSNRSPSAVRNFTASNITTTSLMLAWDEYTNAEGYQLDYCEGSSCTNYSNSENTTGLTRQIDSLTQGTVYKFRIRASLPNNRYSAYRTILQGTSLNAPTLSVTHTQATLTSISLLWTTVTNADGYVIEQCKRESKTTECTDYTISKTITGGDTTTTNIQSLTSSSLYQFRIKSIGNNPKVDSSYSSSVQSYTKFLPPTNLRAANPTSTTIELEWDVVPMGEGYTIKQCTSPTSCTEQTISGSTTNGEQMTGLTPNTAYTLSIRTNSSIVGNSEYSSTITSRTALSEPSNLRKTSSTLTSLTVAWDTVAGADGYILQACEGETCTNFASIYTGALLTYQHTNLTARETYRFRVKATGTPPKIDSDWSTPVNLIGELDPPTNLRAASQTNTTIDLAWDISTDAVGYTIVYCSGGNCTPDETSPETSTTNAKTITGLSANRIYRFKIKATHTNSTFDSDYSAIFEARTTLSTPSNFRKTDQTNTSITLEWNRINNTSGYLIDYCRGSSCTPDETTTATALSTETEKTISSLSSNSIYKFRIKAQANTPSLPSAYSSPIEARTALIAPTTFRVTSRKATSIDLAWDNVAGASGYTIQYCDGTATCTPDETTTSRAATKSVTGLTVNTIYRFRVKATGGAGVIESEYSGIIDSRTTLAVPTGLSSTQVTATSVALSWTAVTDASGYLIQYCDGDSCTDFADSPPITNGATTTKTITGLTANTIYRFRIKATGTNPVVDSVYSSVAEARTALASPTNLRATGQTNTSIDLEWNAVSGATGYSIQYCDGATCTDFAGDTPSTTTTETITGLTANTVYRFRIKATGANPVIDSAYSSVAEARTALASPTNLRATGQTDTSIDLAWNAVTGATGYTIQYCDTASCTDFAGDTPSTTTTEKITGLTANTVYRFRIKTTGANPVVDSAYSSVSEARTALASPTNLRSTGQSGTSIDLEWNAVSGASGYSISSCDGATCTDFAGDTASTTTTETITGLTANTVYRFRIKATGTNPVIDSIYSDAVNTRTTLSVPTNLASIASTITSVSLSWTAVSDAVSYTIQYCDGASCTDFADDTTTTTTSETITGLIANTTYRFRIKATATAPILASAYSSPRNQATAEKLPTPAGVSAVSVNASSIKVDWTATPQANGYEIQYCSGASCTPSTPSVVAGGSITTKTITGLSANAVYRVHIRATHATPALNSDYSDVVEARTTLSTPTNLRSTSTTIASVSLAWNVVAGATGYTIQYCDGATCDEFDEETTSTTITEKITGLSANTTYIFRVKATAGSSLESAYSAILNQATADKLSIPTGLSASSVDASSIKVDWTATPDAEGYEIQYCSGATCTPSTPSVVAGGATITKTISSLTANTVYRVQIRATHSTASYNSDYSSADDTRTTLSVPTNLASTASTITSVSLSWTAVSDAVSYTIQYCSSASCTNFAGDTPSTTTTETITGLTPNITYRFRIKATATDPVLESAYSAPLNKETTNKLPTPTGVSASSVDASSIKVDWTATPQANGYEIQYCNDASCTPATSVTVAGGSTVTKTITTLTANTIYRVQVRATHATTALNSDYSGIEEARTTLASPTNLASTASTINSISLSWGAVTDATGYTIQYCSTVSCTNFAGDTTSTTTTETITGLTANTTYRFRIKATATDPVLESAYSTPFNQATAEKLSTPTNLRNAASTSSSLALQWNEVAYAGGYSIDYCRGTSCTPDETTEEEITSGATTSRTITGLVANSIYKLRIKATHATTALNSDYSGIVETRTTLSRPTNLASAASTITSVSLSWGAVSDATGYTIQYCDGATCDEFDGEVTSTTTTETITGLTPGTTYRFRIKSTATAPVLESTYSAPLNQATSEKLPSPAGVSATSVDDSSIKVDWTATPQANGYEIQYCNDASCTPATSVTVAGGSTVTKTITTLTANTIYRVQVRATHATTSLNSDYSGIEEARTTLTPPTNLRSTATTITSTTLAWGRVTDATGYLIQYCDGATCDEFDEFSTITSGNTTSKTITGLSANTAYRFRIKATGALPAIDSAYSSIFDKDTSSKLSTPVGLNVTSQTDTSITLGWTETADAEGYEIQYCNGDSCTPSTPLVVAGGATITQTISTLTANTIYRVQIRATHSTATLNSDYSGIEEARTTLAPPTNLASTASTITSVSLSWTATTDAVSYTIQYCDGVDCDEFDGEATSTTTTETITGLSAGTTYRFRIRATGGAGVLASAYSSPLNQATIGKLTTPTGVSASSVDASSIKVDWIAVNNAEGYEIQYCNGDSCTPSTPLVVAGGATITQTISSLTANTVYRVQIRATHSTATLNSDYSGIEEARTTLAPPTNLASTASTITSVSLSWTAVTDATSYTIQYCDTASCTDFADDTISTTTTETITGLTANTTYRFRIKATATTPVLESAYSTPLDQATAEKLPTPTGVSASSVDASSIKVDWTATPQANGYEIQYCSGDSCTPSTPLVVAGGATITQTISSLTANTVYRVQVRATHSTATLNSDYSSAVDTRTTLSIPTNLASTASTITRVSLSWTAVTDATGYTIQYCDGATCDEFDEEATSTTTTETITGLTANTIYRFRIKATATDPVLESAYSSPVNKATTEKLTTPTGVSATSVDASSIKVDWTATPDAEGYEIQYCSGDSCTPDTSSIVAGGTTITQTISTLTANTIYRVQIRATHSTSTLNSDYSGIEEARTTLSIPTNFRVASLGITSLKFIWDAVTDATGYSIEYCDGEECTDFSEEVTPTTTTETITGLSANTKYRFRVEARASAPVLYSGYSTPLNQATTEKLSTPQGLSATSQTDTSITLEWTETLEANGYVIDYCLGVSCTPDDTNTETVTGGATTTATISSLTANSIYKVRIKATHTTSSLNGDYSDAVDTRTALSAPTNLRYTSSTIKSISFLWDTVAGATGYTTQYCEGVGCTDFAGDTTSTTTTETITGLTVNTTYRVRVKATGGTDVRESVYSTPFNQTTAEKLSVPTNLSSTIVTPSSITLAWIATPDAEGYTIDYCGGVTCTPDESDTETITSGATATATISSLNVNTTYRFRIKATHSTDTLNSDYSDLFNANTGLAKPSNFISTDSTINSITFYWNEVTRATLYTIEYCDGATCDEFDEETTSTTTTKIITGLTPGTTYRFRLKATATSPVAETPYSDILTQATLDKLSTPTNLRNTSSQALSIVLRWDEVEYAQGYLIDYCNGALCTPDGTNPVTVTSGSTTTRTLANLTANSIYKVRIKATHSTATLNSDYSEVMEARTVLSKPTNLASTASTLNSISLEWTAVTGATRYMVEYCDGATCDEFDEEASSTTTTETITGLNANTTYRFRVRAISGTGSNELYGEPSDTLNKATANKLSVPTGLSATSQAGTSITLSWTANSESEGYTIDYCNGVTCTPDESNTETVTSGATTTATISPLTANSIYRFRIKATHSTASFNSDYSTIVSTRTTLAIPTNLASTASTLNSISLEWTAVSGATGYTIQYCDGVDCDEFDEETTSTTTTETITGLTLNTTYRFKVKATATDPVLESAYSAILNKATANKLSAPTGLSATLQTGTSITLSWTANSESEGYTIDYCNGAPCTPDESNTETVTGGATATATISPLTANSIYKVRIKATHSTATLNSDYSDVVDTRTTIATPTNFRAVDYGVTTIKLAWNTVTDATGYTIQYCDTASCTDFASDRTSTNTNETITGLSADTAYRFRVKATGASPALESPYSDILDRATRDKLKTPRISSTRGSSVNVSILYDRVLDATDHKIYWCSGSSCTPTTEATNVTNCYLEGNRCTRTVNGLLKGAEYRFRIRAIHSTTALNSDYSGVASEYINFSEPSNFRSTSQTHNSVTLSWNALTGTGPIQHYEIYYCEGVNCVLTSVKGTTADSTITTYTVTGLKTNTAYRFGVGARNGSVGGGIALITQSTTIQKLTAPANLRSTSQTASSLAVAWDAVTNATGYLLDYCSGASCTPDETDTETITSGATTTKTFASLTANTIYRFRIKATHTNSSVSSDYSDIEDMRTALASPTNPTSTASSVNSIVLSWDEVAGATGYTIQYCDGATCDEFDEEATTTTRTATISGLTPNTTYRFKVKATGGAGVPESVYSAILNQATTEKLSTPTGIRAVILSSSSIRMYWDTVLDADGYSIDYCSGETCTPDETTTEEITSGSDTSKVITGLSVNTIYRFRIKATHSTATLNSDYSDVLDTRTTLSIPTNLRTSLVSVNSVVLVWDAVTDATGYSVEYCGGVDCGGFLQEVTSNTTTATITGLSASTTHRFRVEARAPAPVAYSGYSTPISQETLAKLPSPTGLNITSQTDTSLTLGWTETPDAEGYEIQYCNGATCIPSTPLVVAGGATITQTISPLTANTIYRVQIRATHATATLNSDYSATVDTRTALVSPTNLANTAYSINSVALSWDEVAGATGYTIQYCDGVDCDEFDEEATSTTKTATITGLTINTTYRFKVKATGGAGVPESVYSAILNQATTEKLPMPMSALITGQTATSITLVWDVILDADGYLIDYCEGSFCIPDGTTTEEITSGATTTATISSLTPNTLYTLKIKATHTNSSLDSDYFQRAGRTSLVPPDNFRVAGVGVTSIKLVWDEIAFVGGYTIQYCDGVDCDEFDETETITGATITEKIITGLTANTPYRFRIKTTHPTPAYDSEYSSPQNQATNEKLSSPQGLSATSQTDTSITLGWTEALEAEGYLIDYCSGTGCTPDETSTEEITSGSDTEETITGLTANTVYRVRIKATHTTATLNSDYSAIADMRTALIAPTNLASTASSVNSVVLSWDAVAGAAGYTVQYCDGASCTDFAGDTASTTSPATITGLTHNTTYRFRVKATGGVDSAYSALLNQATTNKLSTPLSFTTIYDTATSIAFSWLRTADAQGYLIDYCVGYTCTPDETTTAIVTSGSTTTKTVTGLSTNTAYRFRIKATHTTTSLNSDYSEVLGGLTSLATPTSLASTAFSVSSVVLSWDAVTDATGYTIQYCEGVSCTNSAGEITSTTTTETISGLTANTTYRFRVKATSDINDSSYSDRLTQATTEKLPSPSNLREQSKTDTSITLAWNAVLDAEGYSIEYCNGEGCTPDATNPETISSGATTTKTITGLMVGVSYSFRIKATHTTTTLNSDYSDLFTIDGIELVPPTNLASTSSSVNSVVLSWDAVAGAAGYTVQYCDGEDCTDFAGDTTSTTSPATITGLTHNTTYRFRVKTTGGAGVADSGYSDILNQATAEKLVIPDNLTRVSVTSTSTTLRWDAVPDAGGYLIDYCAGTVCTPDETTTEPVTGGATTSKTITGLVHNTTFRFRIKATHAITTLNSDYSGLLTVRTILSTPTNLASTASSVSSIALSWNEVTYATGYTIQYCDGVDCDEFDEETTSTTTTAIISGLTQNTTYRFRVKATAPTPAVHSEYSSLLNQATTDKLPSPANLRQKSKTDTSITLEWNSVLDAEGYLIDYCDGVDCTPDETNTEIITSGETSEKTITELTVNETYKFRIKATHATPALSSDYSSSITQATTLSTPANFEVDNTRITSIELDWDEVAGASGYKIDYCDGVSCTEFDETETVTGSTNTEKIITGLTLGTPYRFKIKATHTTSAQDSAYTSILGASTLSKLAAPTNVRITASQHDRISLAWDSVPDTTSYTIQACEGTGCTPSTPLGVNVGNLTNGSLLVLTTDTVYRINVVAKHSNASYNSDPSATLDGRTTIYHPTNLISTVQTPTSLTFVWTASANASGYMIDYCEGERCTIDESNTVLVPDGETTTKVITGLTEDTTYRFRIKATANPPRLDSIYAWYLTQSTPLETLAPPDNFRGTASEVDSITLAWNAVTNASGYEIDYCEGASCTTFDETETITSATTTSKKITELTVNTAYRFKIKATHATPARDSVYSGILDTGTTLAIPTNFRSTAKSVASIALAWNAVAGATGYTVEYCKIGAGSCEESTSTTTSTTITDLDPNSRYSLQVKATGGAGTIDSGLSSVLSITTTSELLTPTNFRVTLRKSSNIALGWNKVTDATGYTIQHCSGSTSCTPNTDTDVSSGSTTSKTITGLTSNTRYRFRIRATRTSSSLNSSYSGIIDTNTELAVPANFRSTAISNSSVALAWNAVSGATRYNIRLCGGAGCTNFAGDRSSTTTTETVTGLTSNRVYRFIIRAQNSDSSFNSDYSSPLDTRTILASPSNLRSTFAFATYIDLAWNAVTDATSYTVQYCGPSSSCTNFGGDATPTTTSQRITGLGANAEYRFRVKANHTTTTLSSDYSDIKNIRTTIATPTNIRVTGWSASSITLAWNSVNGASSYAIQYCDGISCTDFSESTTSTTTSKRIAGLRANTSYNLRVRAIHTTSSLSGSYSDVFNARTSLSAPTNFRSTSRSNSSISLAWNSVSGATGYEIEYCKIGSGTCTTATSSDTLTTITGLDSNSRYILSATATGGSGVLSSISSGSVTVTTL